MSKRQNAYLDALLVGSSDAPPLGEAKGAEEGSATAGPPINAGAPARGMTLLARESALARLATGEVKQVTQLSIDPARVRIWSGNARRQAALNEDTCRDLIDAILAENGQKVPALVRRIQGDPDYEYEVIAGTRRHWVISWLRANNYPDMAFLAQVHTLDDEAAFRLADIENRARKDVSDFERARNYHQALAAYYPGAQGRMAERLRLSNGWFSKLLAVGALPDWAVDAFACHTDIQLKTCYPLAQRILALTSAKSNGAAALRSMRDSAREIAQAQLQRRGRGESALGTAHVVGVLMKPAEKTGGGSGLPSFKSAHGRTALSVLSSNRNGVTVRVHAGSGADERELGRLLQTALARRHSGQSATARS